MRRVSRLLFLLAFATLALFACKQENTTPVTFTNITDTDASGDIIGTVDTTDWTNDTTWTATEIALLQFANPGTQISDTFPGTINIAPAYPNPNGGKFTLKINATQQCIMKIALVDAAYEILFYDERVLGFGPIVFPGDSLPRVAGPYVIPYDVSGLTAIHKPTYVRLYYGFYDANDSLFYKGHGDMYMQ